MSKAEFEFLWALLGLAVSGLSAAGSYFLVRKGNLSGWALRTLQWEQAAVGVLHEVLLALGPQVQTAIADGVVTPAERKELIDAGVKLLKARASASALGFAARAAGAVGITLDSFLGSKVEQAIGQRQGLAVAIPGDGRAGTAPAIKSALQGAFPAILGPLPRLP